MPDEKKKKKNLEKVKKFLKKLNYKEIIENQARFYIDMPMNLDFKDGKIPPIKLLVRTIVNENWILAKCLIMYKNVIPKDPALYCKLCEELLKANFLLNEVTYSIDPEEGNIYVETDMPANTEFENFKSEFNSIMFGILEFFNNILPKVGQEIKKESTYTAASRSSDLYT